MASIENAAEPDAWFKVEQGVFKAGGRWTIAESARLDPQLRSLETGSGDTITMDASGIERLDSTGAWLLLRTRRALEGAGRTVGTLKVPERYASLLENLDRDDKRQVQGKSPPRMSPWRYRLYRIGKATIQAGHQGWGILGYLGRVTVETGEMIASPRKNLRFAAMMYQVEETGISALPIVGLLAFLIGVVLAYQGADQLRRFGAEVFTINLLGVGVLREIGGLITAIIVAGRSGSAFTAQLGSMRVNQEIDAMQTMGLNTVDTLVLPRIIGLVIALPLLTFYANIMALIGGAMMCYFDLGITIPVFLRQLNQAVDVSTLMVGLIKAPVFAFVIALVGCYEGFQVERNAASVGQLTTRSVVESVFLVIVLDAAFSIMFSVLGDMMATNKDKPGKKDVIIHIQGLVNGFGSKIIHDHLDLDVYRGEVLGVVGGSGSGKSVLLRTIIGLNAPREGTIEVFGKRTGFAEGSRMRKLEVRWGVLFQEGALFSSQTIAENIQVPLREYTSMSQELMDEIAAMKIALVGLPPDAGQKFPSELSGGMKKRAGLARALALDPELLFLDEPTSGLDPISANQFDELIAELQQSLGLTVFMVTHDLDSLSAVTDRIAVLVDKKIKTGTIEELRKDTTPWIHEYFSGPRGHAALAGSR